MNGARIIKVRFNLPKASNTIEEEFRETSKDLEQSLQHKIELRENEVLPVQNSDKAGNQPGQQRVEEEDNGVDRERARDQSRKVLYHWMGHVRHEVGRR